MATPIAARRLQRELAALAREPVPHIVARPLEDNILEWHYVIAAASDTRNQPTHDDEQTHLCL